MKIKWARFAYVDIIDPRVVVVIGYGQTLKGELPVRRSNEFSNFGIHARRVHSSTKAVKIPAKHKAAGEQAPRRAR